METETQAEKVARLQRELADAENPAAAVEPGSAAAADPTAAAPAPAGTERAAPAPTVTEALQASVAANPELGFIGHLEKLAHDGVKAVISPGVESDVLGVITALLADALKVKL